MQLINVGHILRPKFYEAYCNKRFGKIIPHDLEDWLAGHEDPALLHETAELFEKVKSPMDFENDFVKEYGIPYLFETIPTLENKEIKYLETADIYNDWNWLGALRVITLQTCVVGLH